MKTPGESSRSFCAIRTESGRMDVKARQDRHSDIRQAYIVGKEINHE